MAPVQLEDKANQVQYTGVLTEMLIMLGPAFIKFGQTLSSRADLFSDEVLQELRPLCYMVPSFSTDQVLILQWIHSALCGGIRFSLLRFSLLLSHTRTQGRK